MKSTKMEAQVDQGSQKIEEDHKDDGGAVFNQLPL